jgi:hypothetical protein
MSAITPDLSDDSRCISVHWSLPVQCVLSRTHRANWHEAWHPKSGNRMRYRHPGGSTEQLLNGAWVSLEIPPPGGYCNEQNPSNPKAFCDDRAGHSWMHRVVYDGCTYTWGTARPRPAGVEQLTEDVRTLRARVAELERAAGLVADGRPLAVGTPGAAGRRLGDHRQSPRGPVAPGLRRRPVADDPRHRPGRAVRVRHGRRRAADRHRAHRR